MESYCLNLYTCLQNDIATTLASTLPPAKKVERCFQLAIHKWTELSKPLRHFQFASEPCEIRFFKLFKPSITSEIEYYHLLYFSVLFEPEMACFKTRFWQKEQDRLGRFDATNGLFLNCYNAEGHSSERFYFLRKFYEEETFPDNRIYTGDGALATNGDALVATLLALVRYGEYVKEKLNSL